MDNKRKITCALDSIRKASESLAIGELREDKGLQWAAELLKSMLDQGNKKSRYSSNDRSNS